MQGTSDYFVYMTARRLKEMSLLWIRLNSVDGPEASFRYHGECIVPIRHLITSLAHTHCCRE